MKHLIALVFTTALFIAAPAVAQENGLTLTFDKTVTQLDSRVKETPPDAARTESLSVTLYPDALSTRTGAAEKIYTFADKTLTMIDHDAKTYSITALHAVPITLHRERMNQIGLKISRSRAALNTDAFVGKLGDDLDIDMRYGTVSMTKTNHLVMPKSENGVTTFTGNKAVLATVTQGTEAIPETLKKSWARFLTYETALHPVIDKAVAIAPNVFQMLDYASREPLNPLSTQTQFKFVSAAPASAAPAVPEGYTRTYSKEARLNAVLAKSMTGQAATMEERQKRISAHLAKSEYTPALLIALETTLALPPGEVAAKLDMIKGGLAAGQNMKAPLLAAARRVSATESDMNTYLNILDASENEALEMAYLLNAYKANHINNAIGRKKPHTDKDVALLAKARDYALKALEGNPYLAGVYADMAMEHFKDYDVASAFILWEHTAQLCPGHAQAVNAAKMKADAERDFPEFF